MAHEYGEVPESLIRAVRHVESGDRPNLTSRKGARHEMQVMPAVARKPGHGVTPARNNSADEYNRVGEELLAAYWDKYRGDVPLVAAAYNAGPGAVAKHGGVPPYDETLNYIQKITKRMQEEQGKGFSPEQIAEFEKRYAEEQEGGEKQFSPEQIAEFEKRYAEEQAALEPEVPEGAEPSMLGEAWRRGVSGVKQAGQGVITGALSALGQDELVQERIVEQEAIAKAEAEREAQYPELGSKTFQDIQDTAEKEGSWAAIKKIPNYIGQKVAESAPSTATPLGVGMAAGMVNPALGVAAGITASIVQEFGFMMDRQIEKEKLAGKLEPEKAAIAAIPAGVLDAIADRFTLGMKLPSFLTREVKEGALDTVTKTFGGEVAKHVGKGIIAETPTEMGQTELERWQAGEPLSGPENWAEVKEAGISAGVAGGAAGTLGGTASYLQGAPMPEATGEEPISDTAVEPPAPEPIAPVGMAPEATTPMPETGVPTPEPIPEATATIPEPIPEATPEAAVEVPTPEATATIPEATATIPEAATPFDKQQAAELGLSQDEFKKIHTYKGVSSFETDGAAEEAYKEHMDAQAKTVAELKKISSLPDLDSTVTIGGKDYTKQAYIKSQILHSDGLINTEQAEQNFEALKPKGKSEDVSYVPRDDTYAEHYKHVTDKGEASIDTAGRGLYITSNNPAQTHNIKAISAQDRGDKLLLETVNKGQVSVDYAKGNVTFTGRDKSGSPVPLAHFNKVENNLSDILNNKYGSKELNKTIYDSLIKPSEEGALHVIDKLGFGDSASKLFKAAETGLWRKHHPDYVDEYNKEMGDTTQTKPSYSTAPTGATTGHTAASLSRTLSPEMKQLVASGKAVLHDTQDTLPGENHPANVKGMTTAEGVTHYVANKLTPSTIESVALHEVGVHAGMEKMLGKTLWEDVKNQALNGQGKEFDRARAAVPKGTPDHLRAEETLAYLVEHSPQLSLVRRIVAAIRNFLRSKMGVGIKLSEADARQMATASMRREAKTAVKTAREETAFSKEKLLAPNGKPSNLNAIQHAQVRTPAFKKWFGDWENDPENASKVVDENGEPLVVYHGTDDVRNVFKKGESGALGPGIYTTQRKDHAKAYGTHVQSLYANTKNPLIIEDIGRLDITEAIARDKKFEEENFNSRGAASKWAKDQFEEHAGIGDPEFNTMLSDAGYDGVIYKKGNTFTEISLQKAYQVKSATENTGAFSSREADIRYSIKETFEDELGSFKKQADSVSDKVLPAMLSPLSASGVQQVAGEEYLPGSKKVLQDTRKLAGLRDEMLTAFAKMRRDTFNPYIKKHRKELNKLGDTMSEATLLGVSPGEKGNIDKKIAEMEKERPKGYVQTIHRLNQLKEDYKKLSQPSKDVYQQLANYYKDSLDEIKKAYEHNIRTSGATQTTIDKQIAKFKEQMGALAIRGDYFPLMRFGKFGVAYKDGEVDPDTGEEIKKFTKFDTSAEAKKFLANSKINGYLVPDIKQFNKEMIGDNKSLQELYDEIDSSFEKSPDEAKDELKDFVFQMHLMSKSDASMAKRFIHRKGTPGYSNDVFRAFDHYAMNMARQLPRIKLGRNISNGLLEIRKKIQGVNPKTNERYPEKSPIYYEAFSREIMDALHPKLTGPISNFATGAAFSYYLTSPASAILQLTSVALQGIPSIGKKHGYVLAHAAMGAATKMYLGSGIGPKTGWWNMERGAKLYKDKNKGYKKLIGDAKHADQFDIEKAYKSFLEEGIITSGIHAEAFSGKNRTTGAHENVMQKAANLMDLMSQPFAQMESASRQIVGTAAYIANMKSGMTHAQAVEAAIDSVYLDMGDFGSTGRATLTKSDIARVVWQFQQYGAKLLFSMAKSAVDLASKNGYKRKEAVKHLSGLMAMHWLFAGALGLPAAGMVGAFNDLLKDALSDDEWHNYKADLRAYLEAQGVDRAFINIVLDGPLSTLTGLKLSERLGAHELIPLIHESQVNDTLDVSAKDRLFEMFGGAAGSLAVNISEGVGLFTKGETERAIEKLVPNAIVKNALTATRYGTEGKINAKGEEVIAKEKFTPYDLFVQSLGFTPYKVFKGEESARSAKTDVSFIQDKRTELLAEFREALKEGDTKEALANIMAFNKKYPFAGISGKNIKQSVKTAGRARATSIYGMNFGKGEAAMREKYPGMVDDDSFDLEEDED
jgi:hypothetical protein